MLSGNDSFAITAPMCFDVRGLPENDKGGTTRRGKKFLFMVVDGVGDEANGCSQ